MSQSLAENQHTLKLHTRGNQITKNITVETTNHIDRSARICADSGDELASSENRAAPIYQANRWRSGREWVPDDGAQAGEPQPQAGEQVGSQQRGDGDGGGS
ncbi:hypothetical protein ABZP36_034123 [Zizania latifolia]